MSPRVAAVRPFDEAFPAAARLLDAAGLAPRAALPTERYDALVPPAWRASALAPELRAALVIAAGGRAFGAAFARSPEAAHARDPVDAFVTRVVGEAARAVTACGVAAAAAYAFETRDGAHADFVALGRAAGLGAPSRLGLLVHPEYGPWISLRALLFVGAPLVEAMALEDFAPCDGCAAPCAAACRGGALASRRFDVVACGATRARDPACAARCDARHACPIGRAHAYAPAMEAHHMRAALGPLLARAARVPTP